MTFDELLAAARKNAGQIQKFGTELGYDLSTYFSNEIKQLNDCLDTYSAAKVVIATTIADAQKGLSLENLTSLSSNFDKNWDKFAEEYNSIFSRLPGASKTNVLETFAKTHFGDRIFEAGSVIKKETPNILGGIVNFRNGINSFKGSFRDPLTAATKIKNGVGLIVNSTSQIASSLNNIVKLLQGGNAANAQGSALLEKLAGLNKMKAITGSMSVLSLGVSAIGAYGAAKTAIDSLKKGDIAGAASQGQNLYKQGKAIADEIKNFGKNGFSLSPPSSTNGRNGTSGSIGLDNSDRIKAGTDPNDKQNDDDGCSGADSFVCSNAQIKCTYGDKIAKLIVLPDRTVILTGEPQANIRDHSSMINIQPCGKCHTTAFPPTGAATAAAHGKLTPMPCIPNTPFVWMNGKGDVIVMGDPALMKKSKLKCAYGGTITIVHDGQK